MNKKFDEIIDMIVEIHGYNWLCPRIQRAFRHIHHHPERLRKREGEREGKRERERERFRLSDLFFFFFFRYKIRIVSCEIWAGFTIFLLIILLSFIISYFINHQKIIFQQKTKQMVNLLLVSWV